MPRQPRTYNDSRTIAAPNRDHPHAPAGRLLFALVLLIAVYFIPRGMQANADSHLALSYSLVEHETVTIDRFAPYLVDKAVVCAKGTRRCHAYSDKAPGLSLLTAAVYTPLRFVLPRSMMPANPTGDRFLLRYVLTLLTVSVSAAAFAAAFWRFLRQFVTDRPAMLVAIGYALGSMALPFSMLLFSHALTAALLFWAFMALYRHRHSQARTLHLPAMAGMLAGFAIASEYPTAIIAFVLIGYAVPGLSGRLGAIRKGAAYLVGMGIGFAPAMAYNLAAFGAPFSQGYAHLTNPYYAAGMARGIFGVALPTWNAVWGTTFSPYRGIFVLSPWLLLAAPGLLRMAQHGLRREALLCASVVLCYFTFQAGYAFWDGGASVGPRHFLPALPFLAFPVAFAVEGHMLRRLGTLLIAYSVAVMLFVVATNPLFADPRYVAGVRNPLLDQTLRDLRDGVWQNNWGMVFGLRGPVSLLPLAVLGALLAYRIQQRLAAGDAGMVSTSLR